MEIKNRIINYWSRRSGDFARLRRDELNSYMADLWLEEIRKYMPDKPCRILDIGTGSGFFAILLGKAGHYVEGIDLTASMIEEAKLLAAKSGVNSVFKVMDAENLLYPDESFDIVLSRNLTWTLPHPRKAYSEWHRVLKKGGMLLNFDADYGKEHLVQDLNSLPQNHAHHNINSDLLAECDSIKANLDISQLRRPQWDSSVLQQIGFAHVDTDETVGKRIYSQHDEFYNPTPLFLIRAVK
ncbi:class I SAM-dependent methyltransferase [Megamonas hypermegale]|uniref:class I SAM-dependent methyltransferase n=1 Tax=Megamonas hypermegale TaxID=158847 RepID=UPI0025A3801B|nr:class I SAM-dependent methyltransferase [Megamonas hypermegale]MDM8142206.1 class I SAM-dependent methyltransferase [Megamonas hypermegale]